MLMCIIQHLINTCSTIYEKVKQHLGWAEKKRSLQKKRVFRIMETQNLQRAC